MARCYARAPSPVQALPGANQDHFHPPGTLLDTLSSAVLVTDESDTVLSGSAYDYATLAYDAATGHQRWATAYAGPGKNNVATSLTVNPATGTVYVTGYSTGNTSAPCATANRDRVYQEPRSLHVVGNPTQTTGAAIHPGRAPWEIAMRSRVLTQALSSAAVAAAISTLAACGPTTLSASHKPAAAQSGSHASSARHHGHRAHHHAAPVAPSPGTAASPASAQTGPDTAAKRTPVTTCSQPGAQQEQQPLSAPGDGVVRFGTVTIENRNSTINIDPDRQALTALFSDLEAKSDDGVPCNGTRMVIPLTGSARNATIKVYASGYAFTRHATARLSLTLNGQTIVQDFPSGTDDDFVLPIELPAIGESAYQLSIAIDEQPNSHRGGAYINVSAIDAEIT